MRIALIILDGWGLPKNDAHSAIAEAATPCMDACWRKFPHSQLNTSGSAVGLLEGQMGNSEVGHVHIGAGRTVPQPLLRIHQAIKQHHFQENAALLRLFSEAKARNGRIHLLGLVSKGGVHAHTQHLEALCALAQQQACRSVFVHAFLDGRDMAPCSGSDLLTQFEPRLQALGAKIATFTGRYYAMDRDKRWPRTQKACDAITLGHGISCTSVQQALQASYSDAITDEFVLPHVVSGHDGLPVGLLQSNDLLICFNFRPDRMIQLVSRLTCAIPDLHYATMTRYAPDDKKAVVLYGQEVLKSTLGEALSVAGKSQLRAAESEKYPHVTYFLSGGQHSPFLHEERLLCPSPKVATYDLQPKMSAFELTEAILGHLRAKTHDFVCINYANADMVGHTGIFEATVEACTAVDQCLSKVISAAQQADYGVLIMADHGNAEQMRYPDGNPHTAHTINPVPCILLPPKGLIVNKLRDGDLIDIAPTILKLMGLEQPKEMTGKALYD